MKKPIKPRNDFLEQMRRAQGAKPPAEKPVEKPTEEMSAEDLDAAIVEARRELLDAQHAELREREKARAGGTTQSTQPTGRQFLPNAGTPCHWR